MWKFNNEINSWRITHTHTTKLWFQKKNVHPYLGKLSNLTNIFQRGWNHQPDNILTPFHMPCSVRPSEWVSHHEMCFARDLYILAQDCVKRLKAAFAVSSLLGVVGCALQVTSITKNPCKSSRMKYEVSFTHATKNPGLGSHAQKKVSKLKTKTWVSAGFFRVTCLVVLSNLFRG